MAKNRYGVAPYRISGVAEVGYSSAKTNVRVDEVLCARSLAQATARVARALSDKYRGQRVYLGNCQRQEISWEGYTAWQAAQKPAMATSL